MVETRKVSFQDSKGNIYFLETSTDMVFDEEGNNLGDILMLYKKDLDSHKAEKANKAHGGFKGAILRKLYNQTVPSSTWTNIVFEDVLYGSDFWDNINNRFIIPDGISKVRITSQVTCANQETTEINLQLTKNGVTESLPVRTKAMAKAQYNVGVGFITPVMDVIPGDYFEIEVFLQIIRIPVDVFGASTNSTTFFALEVIE